MSAHPRYARREIAVRRAKSAFMMATLVSAFGLVIALAFPAFAEPQASDLSGRWSQEQPPSNHPCKGPFCHVAYDLVPCGNGWCGIEVKNGGDCGRVVFRVNAGAVKGAGMEFTGQFEKAGGVPPNDVRIFLQDAPDSRRRIVFRSDPGVMETIRRTFSLNMVLVREGEPVCKADAPIG